MVVCQRCGRETGAYSMSYFNTQTICMDCKDKEKAHPKYREAVDAECAAVIAGNHNFPGIGLPPDLR